MIAFWRFSHIIQISFIFSLIFMPQARKIYMRISQYVCLLTLICLVHTGLAQRAEHLSRQVNSEFEEREPILSPDGRTLFFWRRATPANTGGIPDPGDIWFSRLLGDNTWTSAVRIGPPLNSSGHDFVWHISPSNDTIWINQVRPGGNEIGLMYSVKTRSGFWTNPRKGYIDGFVYSGNYKDFFIGPGNMMLIPNESDEGYGGTDIYVCFPTSATTWSKPINLGPSINTPGDDDAPFLAPDGKTLYFNSNGHGGLGDHDIFVSKRLDDSWQNWSTPVSIGYPINTPAYDFDFILSADGRYAYWGSEMNTFGDNDIFRLDLMSCELDVYPKGNHTVCKGETFTLEAGFANESDLKYQWKRDGNIIPGANSRRLAITEPGSYSLLRIRNKCVGESEPQIVRFIDAPTAEIRSYSESICLEDSVRLRTPIKNGETYQWKKNGLDIPNANRSIYWVKTPGTYSLEVSNGRCDVVSKPIALKRFQSPTIFQAQDSSLKSPLVIPQWVWTNKLEPRKGTEIVKGIAVSDQGSAYVISLEQDRKGRMTEHITSYFPGGPYRFSLTERKTQDDGNRYMHVDAEGNLLLATNEIFLSKYNYNGRLQWRIDQSIDKVTGVTTDEIGNVYTLARYRDSMIFEGTLYPATPRGSMILTKHNPDGEFIWARTMSVDWYKYDFGNAIHSDCEGNVYIAGGFSSIANFRKKILRSGLTGYSYFISKYNTEGEFQWANKIKTDKMGVRTHDIYTDCKGNTYAVFNYKILKYDKEGNTIYDKRLKAPGPPRHIRISATELGDLFLAGITQEKSEFFVNKLDFKGNQVNLWRGKGASDQLGDLPVIDVDGMGNIYVAGTTKGGNIPPGTLLASRRKSQGFLAKYGKKRPSIKPGTIDICEGDVVTLMTQPEKGIVYQWLRNGVPIEGATGVSYTATLAGDYQVRAIAAPCERESVIQRIEVNCGKKPPIAAPPIASTAPPKPQINTDVDRNNTGAPVRIRNTRVKKQDDFFLTNPKIKVYVWDHGAVDQDTISLNINGVWVLENYKLEKQRKEIEFTLDPNSEHNFIILYAHNLGTTPPNTATILVDDGLVQQSTKLRSNLNSSGSINIQLGRSRGRE